MVNPSLHRGKPGGGGNSFLTKSTNRKPDGVARGLVCNDGVRAPGIRRHRPTTVRPTLTLFLKRTLNRFLANASGYYDHEQSTAPFHFTEILMPRLTLPIAALFSLLFLPAAGAADWKPAAGPLLTALGQGRLAGKSPAGIPAAANGPQGLAEPEWPVGPQTGRRQARQDPRALPRRIGPVGRDEARRPHDLSPLLRHPPAVERPERAPDFGAVDWEAKVSVNGKELGVHRGGYDDFSFDITAALNASGRAGGRGRGLRPHR